jgi:fatty-acyl-CoA synthase
MKYLTDLLARRADLGPQRIAFTSSLTGENTSYAALHERTGRAASLLAALGVEAGDRVGVLCRNRVEFFEVLFACARVGAIGLPLNWRSPAPELAPLLADAAPKVLFYGIEDAGTAHALSQPGLQMIGFDLAQDYPAGLAAHAPHAGRERWPAEDIWYMLYTSGTTGRPKAVIQTYGMAMVNAINIGQAVGLTGQDVTLNFLPLFHTAGINLYTLPALIHGARVVILPGFDAGVMIDMLAAGELTAFFGVPAVYQLLSLHPRFAEVDLSRVRTWGCGGAPLPDALVHTFAARGAMVCNGFGMTETGPTAFLMDPEQAPHRIGSVGKTQILSQCRIVSPEGRPLPPGEVGELQLTGPGITPGYWRQPEATATAFTADGWLRTGDLARADAEGYVYVAGRLKEMFISGGENVYPAEVENVLALHPRVLEAAVIGVPDARWGEVGHAFLMARDGATLEAEELRAFCKARLAGFKVPTVFHVVADFPRTAAGKVQKHLLPRPAPEGSL